MTLTNLEKAVGDRDVLATLITILETAVADHSTTPVEEEDCDIYLEQSNDHLANLQDIHRKIVLTKPADITPHADELVQLCTRLNKINIMIKLKTN